MLDRRSLFLTTAAAGRPQPCPGRRRRNRPHRPRGSRPRRPPPRLARARRTAARRLEDDYERALGLREAWTWLTEKLAGPATCVENRPLPLSQDGRGRLPLRDGRRPQPGAQRSVRPRPAGAAVAKATGDEITALRLPFDGFKFVDDGKAIEFELEEKTWRCDLTDYACAPHRDGRPRGFGVVRDLKVPANNSPKRSPDGQLGGLVEGFDVVIRPAGGGPAERLLAPTDRRATSTIPSRSSGRRTRRSSPPIACGPASGAMVTPGGIFAPRPGPAEAAGPALSQARRPGGYRAAGGLLTSTAGAARRRQRSLPQSLPALTELELAQGQRHRHLRIRPARPPALPLDRGRRRDRHAARGRHRDARRPSSNCRAACSATTWTAWATRSSGCRSATAGIISISMTAAPAGCKNQITKGEWVVREVLKVDDEKRQIWFARRRHVSGQGSVLPARLPDRFRRHELTPLTHGDAWHDVGVLARMRILRRHLFARWTCPNVSQLRRTSDGAVVAELEHGGHLASWWRPASSRPRSSSPRAATARPTSGAIIVAPAELRSGKEVSGDREHLRRPARLLRAEDVLAVRPSAAATRSWACRRWRTWASSWCRSTAWAR